MPGKVHGGFACDIFQRFCLVCNEALGNLSPPYVCARTVCICEFACCCPENLPYQILRLLKSVGNCQIESRWQRRAVVVIQMENERANRKQQRRMQMVNNNADKIVLNHDESCSSHPLFRCANKPRAFKSCIHLCSADDHMRAYDTDGDNRYDHNEVSIALIA